MPFTVTSYYLPFWPTILKSTVRCKHTLGQHCCTVGSYVHNSLRAYTYVYCTSPRQVNIKTQLTSSCLQ